ncbi:hypothetical protein L3073_02110 [Ancylomarina sp. DW003]|nr:hypothetical protein [Ancylomarina sp. DW003]MDE5420996.1 hypothetical protein [Ancylomarina sp. DW003]
MEEKNITNKLNGLKKRPIDEILSVSDKNGNKATYGENGHFNSKQEAIDSVNSLKNCKLCVNCVDCSDCINCTNCINCSNCKGSSLLNNESFMNGVTMCPNCGNHFIPLERNESNEQIDID